MTPSEQFRLQVTARIQEGLDSRERGEIVDGRSFVDQIRLNVRRIS